MGHAETMDGELVRVGWWKPFLQPLRFGRRQWRQDEPVEVVPTEKLASLYGTINALVIDAPKGGEGGK